MTTDQKGHSSSFKALNDRSVDRQLMLVLGVMLQQTETPKWRKRSDGHQATIWLNKPYSRAVI